MPTVTWLAAWQWCSRRRTSLGSEPSRGQLGLEVLEGWPGPLLVAQELHQPDHERVAQAAEVGSGAAERGAGSCVVLAGRRVVGAPAPGLGRGPGRSAAHRSARRRSSQPQTIRSARRRRFSRRTRRSMVGSAQSSPMVSGATSWNARTNRVIRASSSSLSRVGDQRQGQRVDAGIAGQRRRGQLGQQLVVARRQVVADLAERVVDDVEVVDQPFGVDAGQAATVAQGDELAVDLDEHPLVLDEPAQQRADGASAAAPARRPPPAGPRSPPAAPGPDARARIGPSLRGSISTTSADSISGLDGAVSSTDDEFMHVGPWSLVLGPSWALPCSTRVWVIGAIARTSGRGVKLGPSTNDQGRTPMTNSNRPITWNSQTYRREDRLAIVPAEPTINPLARIRPNAPGPSGSAPVYRVVRPETFRSSDQIGRTHPDAPGGIPTSW